MALETLARIQEAIRSRWRCESKHLGTNPESDTFEGMQWQGNVEAFALIGYAEAQYCYAWVEPNGDITTVLQIPPVISPLTAVHEVLKGRHRGTRAGIT